MTDDGVHAAALDRPHEPARHGEPLAAQVHLPGRLFPRAVRSFRGASRRNSLWVTDLEFLRIHYAKTLEHWGDRFETNRDKVVADV